MEKRAFYFPHDSNAKDDPKCILLIEKLGLEGYGTYWVLIETLRDQPHYTYPIRLVPSLARRYGTTLEKMTAVIMEFELFSHNDYNFFSPSLLRRMEPLDRKREENRRAGQISASKRLNIGSTHVQHLLNDGSTSVQPVEESIVYEKRVEETDKKTTTSLETYKDELKQQFSDIDVDLEYKKYLLFFEENNLSTSKKSLLNWVANAHPNGNGHNGHKPATIPQSRYKYVN